MKKNISINISGIIFHIEEDGYDQLKNYLESISRYFSTYEDSKEIIEDIENRIAEIFSQQLTSDKQVITLEDVTSLIATMGTISDFRAIEEEEDKFNATGYADPSSENTTFSTNASKKLFRDTKRKLIGGVASGIADFIGVDPIWIRLILIGVFFGISFIPALSGFTALTYIVLWIVLPGSDHLEEVENVKKLYRNPDNRVISGVCSGLAAYFGADLTLIRILFVIGLFLGGSTIVLYVVLWAITPEAHTITEKMKMQGEPVTLSNIESNIKKNLNLTDEKNENALTKILLFPFRVIAAIFSALGTALGPIFLGIGEVVRVLLGILLIFIPVILFISLASVLGVIFGVADGGLFLTHLEFPLENLINGIPKIGAAALFTIFAIPLIFLCFAGVALLAKRSVLNRAFSLSLLGLFVIAIICSAISIPQFALSFRKEAKVIEEDTFPPIGKTLYLKINANDEMEYCETKLFLRGYQGNEIRLSKEFSARGSSKPDAIEHAKSIDYNVIQKDSSLIFDWNFTFKENALFRGQELALTLYIPYGKEFVIGEGMDEIIRSNIFHGNSYYYEVEGNRWVFEESGMKCLTCTEYDRNDDNNFDFHSDEEGYNSENNTDNDDDFSFNSYDEEEQDEKINGKTKNFNVTEFTGLSISGMFLINVIRAKKFDVKIKGDESMFRNLKVEVEDEILKIEPNEDSKNWKNLKRAKIDIEMPVLNRVEFNGFTKSRIKGFKSDDMKISLNGASSADFHIVANTFELNVAGGAKVWMKGKADHANIDIAGATQYEGYDFIINKADFNISGASASKINATKYLKINASGPCDIRYKGNPHLVENLSFLSNLKKEE